MNPDDEKLKIRENLFKRFFLLSDKFKSFVKVAISICRTILTITLLVFFIAFTFYIGVINTEEDILRLRVAFRILFLILFFSKFLPEFLNFRKKTILSIFFEIIVFLFSLGVLLSNFGIVKSNISFWTFFSGNIPVTIAIFLIAISEISVLARLVSSMNVPPALLFSSSFLIIILIGSGLLMLPNAHTLPLTFLDSFFTSVSAVCVTGLIVVDTATFFTPLGKIIIICLIQIGGLGIMTFTGFFSFVFASSSSFRDRLLLKEIFSSQSLDNLFKLLTKIILWTFITEAIGALLIYRSLDPGSSNRVLFSIFHAISAFCNAGFSTLSNGLYSVGIRHNYSVQITIALLVILGGIGFPVLLNVYSFIKQFIIVLIRKVQRRRIHAIHTQMNISGRIVIVMTLLLIVVGSGLYFIFESKNSLNGMDNTQKFIISFFGSVSSRTAGFNITDISLWGYPTIFLILFLMWIGASPGSTGGGIKTTTFAIALRSAFNSIKGRQHLVIGNREIGSGTIIRVLAIIFLSILIITVGFFCLLISEPTKNPVYLLFESVSAFSTVGLSLANTPSFSDAGKIIVILLMFIGRVGPLTLLTGLLLSYRKNYSRYPEIDIIIN
jgi:trk system potassium uptake protein TrkH